ncbi:TPA: baseplate J/gp47 family protein [Enterobacter kobei]|nr:baseplate J/gp47 family protein [Enterobacter kobei]
MNKPPSPDFEEILADNGMPVTEEQVRDEFNEIVSESGLITNTSRMSPFWRLITSIVTAPVMWLKDIMVTLIMPSSFLATASGTFIDLFAWAVNLSRKQAEALEGVIWFAKSDPSRSVNVPAGTIVQTERINGVVRQVKTLEDFTIPVDVEGASIPVIATEPGSDYNLAPGYFRILPVAVDGIASVQNNEDWISSPGTDTESDDELRDRTRNQFNLVGQYHIDAVYRGMISSMSGLTTDRIYFRHEAPRGPGTANVYLLLDAGIASEPFIEQVNDYVMAQGHHGHGDDVLCLQMPETEYDVSASLFLYSASDRALSEEERERLRIDVANLIRCAFRENTFYDVQKTWPFARFSFSRLGEEIHDTFPEIESVVFSRSDILSDLDVPRLGALDVEYG